MGKPTGFMDYKREDARAIAPKERIKNFNEFHIPLSEEEQRKQSARCMDCGVPFCQSGVAIKGMTTGCPLNNLIPEWNDLVYTGNWEQPIINIPTMAILPGINESPRLTVLSTPPAALIVPENAPAARNTRHMVIIFSSASPLAISDIFSLKVTLRFCTNATASAIRNATIAGIL